MLTQGDAHFEGDVKPEGPATVYKDFQLSEREAAIKPRLSAMLRHGACFAPAPMCFFWAPVGRVASLLTVGKTVQGAQASGREVINICQGAWDVHDGDWIFQILMLGGPPDQFVYIRADPTLHGQL